MGKLHLTVEETKEMFIYVAEKMMDKQGCSDPGGQGHW